MPPSDIADAPQPRRPRGRPPLAAKALSARRQRIVAVAARMFFTQGYVATRLEEIGREAGVTKRAIYQAIGDKRTLFQAACHTLCAEGPRFTFDIPVAGRSARDVLCHMAEQLIAHSLDPELIMLERAVIAETANLPGVVSDVVADGKDNLMAALGRVFAKLAQLGTLPRLDTERAANLFYDAAVGARGFRAVFGHPPEDRGAPDIGERIDMFLHGYVARHALPDGA